MKTYKLTLENAKGTKRTERFYTVAETEGFMDTLDEMKPGTVERYRLEVLEGADIVRSYGCRSRYFAMSDFYSVIETEKETEKRI